MTAGHIGRYQISDELGRGAMGVVYRATDPAIGRVVAIKTIRLSSSSPTDRQQHVARLRREAQSAGRLSHPHIVTVFDFLESGDAACVCLEFVDGPSLEVILNDKRKKLSQEEILRILKQAADALDYAHSRGVIHRDVKPANVLLGKGGNVKITDFGIAALVNDDATMTTPLVGTPNYMSPEQVLSQPIGGPSDQFSLAVIAYQLLTGEKPFRGSSLASIVYKVCNENPVAPSQLNPDLSTGVDEVLLKALSKKPEDRFPSVAAFVSALQSQLAARSRPVVAAPLPVTPAQESAPRMIPPPGRVPHEPAEKSRKFSPWLYALGGFAAVALVLLLLGPKSELPSSNGEIPAVTTTPETVEKPVDDSKPSPSAHPGEEKAENDIAESNDLSAEAVKDDSKKEEETAAAIPSPALVAEEKSSSNEKNVEHKTGEQKKTEPAAQDSVTAHPFAIESIPAGATVVIDGLPGFTCKTPCKITLESGRHSFKVDRAGFRTALRTALVPDDTSLKVPLETRSGTVMVRSNPPGAKVFVDGKEWSETTPAMMSLPVGKHVIELRKEGYRNDTNSVTVRDGAVMNLDVNWPAQ